MLAVESKTGIAKGNPESVFNYVSDFRNFAGLLPGDRLSNLQVEKEKIVFDIQGLGTIGLEIHEKKPFSLVTIGASEDSSADFTFNVHITESEPGQSEVKLKLKASLSMFLEMMARGPLQQFVDMMAEKLSQVDFSK